MSSAKYAVGKEYDKDKAKEKEADDLVKKGKKEVSPSLCDFRLKPDWEAAAPMFDRAALLYKQIGNVPKALETYERAANAQEKIGSPWHAGKHLETCADISRNQKNWEQMGAYYRQACDMYTACGKITTGGDVMAKGARLLEEHDPDMAISMFLEAIDLYETEGKESNGVDIYRSCIASMVKAKRYGDAVSTQLRFGAAMDKTGQRSSQMRAYLGGIVIYLYAGDAKNAWATYQDVMAIDAFANSDEAFKADGLFNAYRTGEEEAVKAYIAKNSVFKNLDNQVARLAVKLPTPTRKMRKMARDLEKLMAEGEEEEEEGEGDGIQ